MANETLLSSLAEFAASFRYEDAPEAVRAQGKLSILDTVGCIVAGSRVPESVALESVEAAGIQPAEASIAGRSAKVARRSAIRCNAYFGDVFELNDLTGGHASIAIVPTALATAEARDCAGRQLLEAVVVGVEVTSRVYTAYYSHMKSYEETGITPPGIPSTLGAAAAVARLEGFSTEQTERTLAIAAALAGWCPAEAIFGQGGTIKPMLFGAWPGSIASEAVAYARAGFSGPSRVLESPIGLYATLARKFDASAITGETWHLARPRRKRHACCGYIHSAIDAVIALRQKGADLAASEVIQVGMPAYIVPRVSRATLPSAANEARFHAQYCIALAVAGADIIAPRHSIEYPAYIEKCIPFMRKIRITADPSLTHYHQCVVKGFDKEGRERFAQALKAPRGAPLDPMTDEEVRDKFHALTWGHLSEQALKSYVAAIDGLDSSGACDWIIRSFV